MQVFGEIVYMALFIELCENKFRTVYERIPPDKQKIENSIPFGVLYFSFHCKLKNERKIFTLKFDSFNP